MTDSGSIWDDDPRRVSLASLYALVPAAEEEDLVEQVRDDEQRQWTTELWRAIGLLDGDDDGSARSAPAQQLLDDEDPEDWALPALCSPRDSGQWRTAVALARSLVTLPLRLQLPRNRHGFFHEFSQSWRFVTGEEPPEDRAGLWLQAATAAGLSAHPAVLDLAASPSRLCHLMVGVCLEADLPALPVADALDGCVREALGWTHSPRAGD